MKPDEFCVLDHLVSRNGRGGRKDHVTLILKIRTLDRLFRQDIWNFSVWQSKPNPENVCLKMTTLKTNPEDLCKTLTYADFWIRISWVRRIMRTVYSQVIVYAPNLIIPPHDYQTFVATGGRNEELNAQCGEKSKPVTSHFRQLKLTSGETGAISKSIRLETTESRIGSHRWRGKISDFESGKSPYGCTRAKKVRYLRNKGGGSKLWYFKLSETRMNEWLTLSGNLVIRNCTNVPRSQQ